MEKVECDICGKVLYSKYSLQIHIAGTHRSEYKFQCEHCNLGFYNRLRYNNHMEKLKTEGKCPKRKASAGSSKAGLVCEVCDVNFSSKQNLRLHKIRKHSGTIWDSGAGCLMKSDAHL